MPNNRAQLRGTVLAEDRRTEGFFRKLLVSLGFETYNLRFNTAPSGKGAAEAWVRAQYPSQVRRLRHERHQRLFLIAVRDGDRIGSKARKDDLDNALQEAAMEPRQSNEHIAIPVPMWSIETWLLALLGHPDVNETESLKQRFDTLYKKEEGKALREAAEAWRGHLASLESLADGKIELNKIDFH